MENHDHVRAMSESPLSKWLCRSPGAPSAPGKPSASSASLGGDEAGRAGGSPPEGKAVSVKQEIACATPEVRRLSMSEALASDDEEEETTVKPVDIRRDFAVIRGGHLPKQTLAKAWMAEVTKKDEVEFVTLDLQDPHFLAWLGGNTEIVTYLADKRAETVTKALGKAAMERDPRAEVADLGGHRRELSADIPEMLPVKVGEGENKITMMMLVEWHRHRKVRIEITERNLQFILDMKVEKQVEGPIVSEPNVKWVESRHEVLTEYYDAARQKKRKHFEHVPQCKDADALQAAVDVAARACQTFYDSHHTEPGSLD